MSLASCWSVPSGVGGPKGKHVLMAGKQPRDTYADFATLVRIYSHTYILVLQNRGGDILVVGLMYVCTTGATKILPREA